MIIINCYNIITAVITISVPIPIRISISIRVRYDMVVIERGSSVSSPETVRSRVGERDVVVVVFVVVVVVAQSNDVHII